MLEFGIIEVAEDRLIAGEIHGLVMIRAQPLLVCLIVAISALLPTHKARG